MMFLFSSILFYSIILLWATITQAAQTEVRLAGIFKFLDEEVKGNTTTVIRDKQGNQILAAVKTLILTLIYTNIYTLIYTNIYTL